jgi:MoxR-like ATPase
MSYKDKITQMIKLLSSDLHEREHVIANCLLAILSGQSIFLYGLPGTAKSLIARRLSTAFADAKIFEYLMQKFSTPEDIFGPISIQELKQDRYIRKTESYLPTADFAFLDEIWKSSPAILNTLLTIINEKIFKNGDQELQVPLKALIAASNELPASNQGLEALYDRFTMRLQVNPMSERKNFEALLNQIPTQSKIAIDSELQFNDEQYQDLQKKAETIKLSKESLNVIHAIRSKIDEYNEKDLKKKLYVSDRRWQKIASLLKTQAILCDRTEVLPVDLFVLKHCLWTTDENINNVHQIIEESIKGFSNTSDDKGLREWLIEFNQIEKEFNETFIYGNDEYETEKIEGVDVIKQPIKFLLCDSNYRPYDNITINIFVDKKYISTNKDFFPNIENKNNQFKIRCNFNGTKVCKVYMHERLNIYTWNDDSHLSSSGNYIESKSSSFTPNPKYNKGAKQKVSTITRNGFIEVCNQKIEKIKDIIQTEEKNYQKQNQSNDNQFILEKDRLLVTDALNEQIKQLKNHLLDAERLLKRVTDHDNLL